MNQENRICQNCKKDFVIEPDDFQFYERIQVPPPSWCPECRMMRRLTFWNEHNLFRKKDARTGAELFSTYPEESPVKVYEHDFWWSDGWDPLEYGQEYDFKRPFFEQYHKLMLEVPWPATSTFQMINSPYCNQAGFFRNCYLCFNGDEGEDCRYGVSFIGMKNSLDFYECGGSDTCYEIILSGKCFQTFFSAECGECRNVWFSKNLTNCQDCIGCVNLKNRQYHIFNRPYSREEYHKKLKEFNFGSYKSVADFKKRAREFWLKFPRKYISGGRHNQNVVGEYVYRSKNCKYCYQGVGLEDCRYTQNTARNIKDCYDYTNWGNNVELMYESVSCGENCQNIKFCHVCWPGSNDLEYSMNCHSSSNLFGCLGLKKKQYFILNQHYPKDEYFEMVKKIKKHMDEMPYIDQQGRVYKYGEFFPPELSPLAYNESVAMDYFPKSRNEIESLGFIYREVERRKFNITVRAGELPDNIRDVTDEILKENIGCAACEHAFKITATELRFYRHFGIPLPRSCFGCRHKARLRYLNPLKWQVRQCMCGGKTSDQQPMITNDQRPTTDDKYTNTVEHFHGSEHCPNEFETSYAPWQPEIVYCESCYNAEVA